MKRAKKILLFVCFLSFFGQIFSQTDTVVTVRGGSDSIFIKDLNSGILDTFPGKRAPWKAALLSTFLPGAGQAYNRKYWKIPIVYTVIGGMVFLADRNNKSYRRFSDAYVALNDTLEYTVDEFGGLVSNDELLFYMKKYRRDRDLSIIVAVVVYGFNIMDAVVDAHLADYDISDDLSLNWQPVLMKSYDNRNLLAVRFSLRF